MKNGTIIGECGRWKEYRFTSRKIGVRFVTDLVNCGSGKT